MLYSSRYFCHLLQGNIFYKMYCERLKESLEKSLKNIRDVHQNQNKVNFSETSCNIKPLG